MIPHEMNARRPSQTFEFDEGVMWESGPWKLAKDYPCSAHGGFPCRHCHSYETLTHVRSWDQSTYTERVWICPRLVIVTNEGGYNSTGLCLDCLLEAVAAVG